MQVHYTGRQVEFPEAQRKKLEVKFQKIRKILGDRNELEAHVILSQERHIHHAEVTLNYRHNTMVVECAGPDLFSAMHDAAEKLERQVIRNKNKWRERKRRSKSLRQLAADVGRERERAPKASSGPRVFRRATPAPKPLTIEEAVLEMEQQDRDYVFYRDADKGRPSVLFRRRDGNLQLVEA